MKIFKSAFEKLSTDYLEEIRDNTEITAGTLSPGGSLFTKVDEMVKYLKIIAKEKTSASLMDAALLKMIGGKTIKGIGEGFQLIVKALNELPDAKEAREKMAVMVTGIQALSDVGGAILKFAGSLALATPLLIIGLIGLPILALSIAVVGGAFYLLDKMGVDKSMHDTSKALSLAGLAILSLGASIALFSIILPPKRETFVALAMAGLVVVTIAGAFWLIDKMQIDKSIIKTSFGLVIAAGAILALGYSLSVFTEMFPATEASQDALMMAGATIVGVALAFGLAGLFAGTIAKGALAMILSAIPIIMLAYSMKIFTESVPPTADGWESIAQIGALVTGLGLVMAAAGAAAVLIIPGAAAMLVSGVALVTIAMGVKAISKVFADSTINKMLEDSGHETEGFLGFGGGRMMSKLEWLLLSIARSFTLPADVLAGMYAAMPVMMSSGLALLSIAKGIEKVQALDIDYEVFPDQVSTLVNTLAEVFGEIGKKYPGGGGGMLSALLGSSDGDSPVAQGISAVGGMGRALSSIAMGVQQMANLAFPIKWDKNGNPVEFRQLTEDDFVRLGTNTTMIVNALSETFAKIGNDPAMGKGGRSGFFARVFGGGSQSPVADGISAVMGMGEAIGGIAKGVQLMADLKFPIYDKNGKITGYEPLGSVEDIEAKLTNNMQKLILALTGVFGKIGADPNAEDSWGWFGHSNTEEGIQLVTDIVDPIMKVAKMAESLSNMKLDTNSVTKKIKLLLTSLTGGFGNIGSSEMAEAVGEMWENIGDGVEDIGDGMGNIADGINDMDMEKLTEARKMFEAIALLSKSSPEDIFSRMSESLEAALQNLADMLGEFKGEVQKSGESTGALASAVDGVKTFFGGSNDSSEGGSNTIDISEVVDAIRQLEDSLAVQGIKINNNSITKMSQAVRG